jgi:hypothetical protein
VSQPDHADHHFPPEPDPLLAFFAEPDQTPAPAPVKSAEPVEPRGDAAAAPAPSVTAEPDPELRRRLERAERQLEKSQIEISTLKSDLATLVSVVDDIKKRQSRRDSGTLVPAVAAAAVPLKSPARISGAVAAIALVVFGLMAWGAYSATSIDVPEPAPVETESVQPPVAPSPAPSVVATPPEPQIQKAAAVTEVQPPAVVPARAAEPARPRPAPVSYVGALTVDAEPAGEVFLNRKSVGRTPVRLDNLRAGSHLVWIERQGYRRFTRVVAVTADNVARVSAELEPLTR